MTDRKASRRDIFVAAAAAPRPLVAASAAAGSGGGAGAGAGTGTGAGGGGGGAGTGTGTGAVAATAGSAGPQDEERKARRAARHAKRHEKREKRKARREQRRAQTVALVVRAWPLVELSELKVPEQRPAPDCTWMARVVRQPHLARQLGAVYGASADECERRAAHGLFVLFDYLLAKKRKLPLLPEGIELPAVAAGAETRAASLAAQPTPDEHVVVGVGGGSSGLVDEHGQPLVVHLYRPGGCRAAPDYLMRELDRRLGTSASSSPAKS